MLTYDLVVIGGGPAGLAAAAAARQAGVQSILILERDRELGGILNQCIHSGFGLHAFGEELTGPEYAARYIDRIESLGIEYRLNTMVVELTPQKRLVALSSAGLIEIQAGAVVLAMGCRERTAGAIAVNGYRPAGVYTAGMAQRLMNMEGLMVGRSVVIYGSGDIGLIMARRMTLEGAQVKCVVEILPRSGGLNRNIVQCLDDYQIPLYLSHCVQTIHGKSRIEGVTIAAVDRDRRPIPGTETDIACDTLLLSVGLIPENELSAGADVAINPRTKGALVTSDMETSQSGIFACGNVLHVHDIVDFVSRESAAAGRAAARYLLSGVSSAGKTGFGQAQAPESPKLPEQLDMPQVPEPVLPVLPGAGIAYVVPNAVLPARGQPVDLLMRVRDVYADAALLVRASGRILKKKRLPAMIPSEMVRVVLDAAALSGVHEPLTVEVEGCG